MDNKSNTNTGTPRRLQVKDANLSDEKIPRNLILMYGGTPYIQKGGLEWKANQLFGGAGYSITVELVERNREQGYYLAKAILTVLANGAVYENYGEASKDNVNSMMQKNLLHLAITRAECRVLRMATACGYASYDEVMTLPQEKVTQIEDADAPATNSQVATLKALGAKETPTTKSEAIELIKVYTKK